jgi:hypothetical protein
MPSGSADYTQYPPEQYSNRHQAVFVDSSSLVNLLAGTSLGALDLVSPAAAL